MKTRLFSLFIASAAFLSNVSQGAVLALTGITNTSLGLVTVDVDNTAPFPPGSLVNTAPRAVVSGSAVFVSVTTELSAANVLSSMNGLLSTATSTITQFNSSLATLIGATSATSPGIIRSASFTDGLLNSTGTTELGSAGNRSYLFLVAESNGFITGIGAYTGSNVPAGGALTFNPGTSGDSLLVGTSVLAAATVGPVQPVSGYQLAAAIPEPSAALLGALGALGLLRRRRI